MGRKIRSDETPSVKKREKGGGGPKALRGGFNKVWKEQM